MSFVPKEFLKRLSENLPKIKKHNPGFYQNMVEQEKMAFKDGSLDNKTKELIAVALSIATKCPYCIPYHVEKAFKAGASKDELMEVSEVAITMGGLPATTYATMMLQAIDELEA